MKTLKNQLDHFIGTTQYFSLRPFSHLVLTDGAKYFNDITPLVQDVAIAITHKKHLREQEFLSIVIEIENGNCVTKVDDGNDKLLYQQRYDHCDVEDGTYTLFATGGVLMLASEY